MRQRYSIYIKYLCLGYFLILTNLFVFCNSKILYNGLGQTQQHKLIAMTIAGIVNRETPELYLLNVYETWSFNQTDEQWRDIYQEAGKFQFRTIININDLIDHFKTHIKGTITYDPSLLYSNFAGQSFMWQGELAMMLGGLTDCIPVASNDSFIQLTKTDSTTLKHHFGNKKDTIIGARLEHPNLYWNAPSLTAEQRYLKALDWALTHILPYTNPNCFYLREITDWTV
ncbi:MAG TPA: GxGYxYP family putative glycoside hydrolase, partial [Saprospiraceae bacterium]|nr:GxGYxYP family putative glycoside hydrolase [Saprospiraceae bacterium]